MACLNAISIEIKVLPLKLHFNVSFSKCPPFCSDLKSGVLSDTEKHDILNRPISQIPQCTTQIYNAPIYNRNVHSRISIRFLLLFLLSRFKHVGYCWRFCLIHLHSLKINCLNKNNRFLPVGLKSNLWERQGTNSVYGSSGLFCSGGSTRNRIVGVRTHPHRVAYPTQTHHWASGWHPVTKAIQKTHIPWLNAISELPSHHNTCVVDCFRYVRQGCRHYWRVLLQSSSKW